MKTLAESIFDTDKLEDLGKAPIRKYYDLNEIYNYRTIALNGYVVKGKAIGKIIDDNKVIQYDNPWSDPNLNKAGNCWIGIMIDAQCPPQRPNDKKWIKGFKDRLDPYISEDRKDDWDNTTVKYSYSPDFKTLSITLSYCQKDPEHKGSTTLNFTRK